MHTRRVAACATLFLVVVTAFPTTVSDEAGPWIIATDTVWSDEGVYLDRLLIIASGATLTLKDLTVVVEDGGGIFVGAGGTLVVKDSRLVRAGGAPAWPFDVQGILSMSESLVSGSYGITMRGPGTMGSSILDSVLRDNADHALRLTVRASIEVHDSIIFRNGHTGTSIPGGILASDASVVVRDSVFIGNLGYSVSLVSSSLGAKVFGPSMATVEGNVIAHGSGGIHVQEGDAMFNRAEGNLITNMSRGLNLQGPAGIHLGGNSFLGNGVAAANFGYTGTTSDLNEYVDVTADLGDSWLGPEGPVTAGVNRLFGPFATDRLRDTDPVPHLLDRLRASEVRFGL